MQHFMISNLFCKGILVNLLKKEKKKLVQAKEATADYQAQSENEESYLRRVSSSSSSCLSQDSDASLTADGKQHAVDDYSKRCYNKLEKSLCSFFSYILQILFNTCSSGQILFEFRLFFYAINVIVLQFLIEC